MDQTEPMLVGPTRPHDASDHPPRHNRKRYKMSVCHYLSIEPKESSDTATLDCWQRERTATLSGRWLFNPMLLVYHSEKQK